MLKEMKEPEQNNPEFIYHLVLESEFLIQTRDNMYIPQFFLREGFIHCTNGEDLTILIANDFFSKEKDLLVLKIRLKKVVAKVLFEPPVLMNGKENFPLKQGFLFPHIYGSLNLDSIEGIAKLPKINYVFHFPKQFISFNQYKAGNQWI